MLIQSLIKRPAGTDVDLKHGKYKFKPEDGNLKPGTPDFLAAAHVADVEDQRDMATLLAIPEGYALYLPEAPKKSAAKRTAPAPAEQLPLAAAAGIATDTLEKAPEVNGEDVPAAPAAPEAPAAAAISQELKDRFEALAGRKPHHKWTAERISKEIADLEAAK